MKVFLTMLGFAIGCLMILSMFGLPKNECFALFIGNTLGYFLGIFQSKQISQSNQSKMKIVESQYQKYLKLAGLNEATLHPIQRIETKRTFFAAFGQALLMLRDEMPDNEDDAINQLEAIKNEVANFFQKESKRSN